MKIAAGILISSLLLAGCSSGSECDYFDRNLARVEGVIYKTDEILKVRELTEEEFSDRINALSERTDLWIKADEVGCPHN